MKFCNCALRSLHGPDICKGCHDAVHEAGNFKIKISPEIATAELIEELESRLLGVKQVPEYQTWTSTTLGAGT